MQEQDRQYHGVANLLPLFDAQNIIVGNEADRLSVLEDTIERGLTTFVEVGAALLEIRDSRLYRATHGTFEDYCRDRWQMARRTAYQLIDAAGVIENVRNCAQILPITESQARPLASLEPEVQREVWQRAVETAPSGKVTAAHVQNVADEYRAHPHVANNSGNNEWYTPEPYIEAARRVLGTIDLDPASSAQANEVVRAATFYTVDDDGLAHEWRGKVFMNPPYARGVIGKFAEKLATHYDRGDIEEAIVLVNNATETAWFQRLAQSAEFVCFPKNRVRYQQPDEETGSPLQGQAVLYFGKRGNPRFRDEFTPFGFVSFVLRGNYDDQTV